MAWPAVAGLLVRLQMQTDGNEVPGFTRAAATGGDLAQMWRNAAWFLPHMAGCACSGPHIVLDRDSVEADLLACLAQTYREAGWASLAGFVAMRADEEDPQPTFTAWLAALDKAPLEESERRRLITDLAAALASLQTTNSGGGFVCE